MTNIYFILSCLPETDVKFMLSVYYELGFLNLQGSRIFTIAFTDG